MRPASIVMFERLILAALAIDLVNNLVSWYRMDIAAAAAGPVPSPAAGLAIGLLSPLLGLIL